MKIIEFFPYHFSFFTKNQNVRKLHPIPSLATTIILFSILVLNEMNNKIIFEKYLKE